MKVFLLAILPYGVDPGRLRHHTPAPSAFLESRIRITHCRPLVMPFVDNIFAISMPCSAPPSALSGLLGLSTSLCALTSLTPSTKKELLGRQPSPVMLPRTH